MLKVVDLSRDPRQCYWHETPPHRRRRRCTAPTCGPSWPTGSHKSPIPELLPTTAWVQVPPDLWEDPETFESFINYRLIVRLATAENDTILCGDGGLLSLPGIARMTVEGAVHLHDPGRLRRGRADGLHRRRPDHQPGRLLPLHRDAGT